MNSTYTSLVVMVLAALLPKFGITLGSDQLTTFVQVLVVLGGAIVAYFSHKKAVAVAGGHA